MAIALIFNRWREARSGVSIALQVFFAIFASPASAECGLTDDCQSPSAEILLAQTEAKGEQVSTCADRFETVLESCSVDLISSYMRECGTDSSLSQAFERFRQIEKGEICTDLVTRPDQSRPKPDVAPAPELSASPTIAARPKADLRPPSVANRNATLFATTSLNLRVGPGTDNPVIGVIARGTPVLITEPSSDPNWWQVRTPDSVFGYLNVNYLSPQRQVEQTLTGVVSQSTGTGETLRKAGDVPFSIGRCGVQVASRSILSEARQVVAELGIQSTAEIYSAPNGWFVIVAGTISETANFARVVTKYQLPDDSICVKATTFSKLDEALRKARNVPFPAGRCGVQVASRPGLDEARQVIDELGIKSTAEIYRAPNGWFVIVAGTISETADFERVIAKYRLPGDSICVKATTFRRLG